MREILEPELIEIQEALREARNDIFQLLRVAKYNLTGDVLGDKVKIPDVPLLVHADGIAKSEAVMERLTMAVGKIREILNTDKEAR